MASDQDLHFLLIECSVKRATCNNGANLALSEVKTESCFSPISSDWLIRSSRLEEESKCKSLAFILVVAIVTKMVSKIGLKHRNCPLSFWIFKSFGDRFLKKISAQINTKKNCVPC